MSRIENAVAFAGSNRVLLLRHEASGTSVDLSLGQLGFEKDTVRRARRLVAFGTTIPVASPADLVILKAVAGRPHDYADIFTLLDANPRLDLARVRRIVGEFAEALEAPDLRDELEAVLARCRRLRARR